MVLASKCKELKREKGIKKYAENRETKDINENIVVIKMLTAQLPHLFL